MSDMEQVIRAAAGERLRESKELGVEVEDITDMAARVDKAGPVGYLVEPIWPADAYGVIAAQDKAGKTWAVDDLAVSVATGGSWLGEFPCKQGHVLVYCGEGGARNIIRRVRAIAEHKGIQFGLLQGHLFVSEQAPVLKDKAAIEKLNEELVWRNPALVIIDPLYLAAIGGKGSDLYAMGELLTEVQQRCQDNGAALLFTHHWNKTGEGTGAKRMTGVGPGAWGRVLGSGSVENVRKDGDKSIVTVEWEFIGSEIPETFFTMVRTVWADNPRDLMSPLHYEVTVQEGLASLNAALARDAERQEKVLAWLEQNPGQAGADVEREFGPWSRQTLRELNALGLATYQDGPRNAKLWESL